MPQFKRRKNPNSLPYIFCTLLAHNYLIQFLALYASLTKTTPSFRLWVLCMDDTTHNVLTGLKLPNVRLISLSEFEDDELRQVKKTRSTGEYCWTCTPSLILYVLAQNPHADIVGYLDADLYFFASPEPIYQEFGRHSILLIPHRHAPEYAFLKKRHGTYNVGLLLFRNDDSARKSLTYWRRQCLKWCSVVPEEDKYGDQAYLNAFPRLFRGVHILKHIGADVAPWNSSQYVITRKNRGIFINDIPLIFYHFAGLVIYNNRTFTSVPVSSFFRINKSTETVIYVPYYRALRIAIHTLSDTYPDLHFGQTYKTDESFVHRVLSIVRSNPWLRVWFVRIQQRITHTLSRAGYLFLRKHYYSPVPDEEDLGYVKKSTLPGVHIDTKQCLHFFRSVIAPYRKEFNDFPLSKPVNTKEFHVLNGSFGAGDSLTYFGILRHYKPRTIIEIGAGQSTLLASEAVKRNSRESHRPTKLYCVDPYPKSYLLRQREITSIFSMKVQRMPPEFFTQLHRNDVLFIDSTHILKPGGDVWWLYNEIIPRLNPGVLIHIHDIELPLPYPGEYTARSWYFTEQYMVQAFLSFNTKFSVLWPASYMWETHKAQVLPLLQPAYGMEQKLYPYARPSSLWLQVN